MNKQQHHYWGYPHNLYLQMICTHVAIIIENNSEKNNKKQPLSIHFSIIFLTVVLLEKANKTSIKICKGI